MNADTNVNNTGRPFVTAIIPAAGAGSRMGGSLPKQFLELTGKPILIHTLEKFEISEKVDDIIILVPCEYENYTRELAERHNIRKRLKIAAGGQNRAETVRTGLALADARTGIALIHDGARPFTSPAEIAAVIEGALKHGACVPGVRPKDTVKISENGFAASTPDRDALRLIQTPQAFRFGLIKRAHEHAAANGLTAFDDATLTEYLNVMTYIIEGSYGNIKITTKEDLIFAEAVLTNH